uniref:Uncharacterized protein n=1 Tax=Trichinella nativa TaxID=6335 RepID=A0A0V1KIQ2_9BILA
MTKSLKNVKNDKCTLKCNISRKTEKGGKCRNVHCRMWNMARKIKIM